MMRMGSAVQPPGQRRYFTRPSNITTAKIQPDAALVTRSLQRAGVKSLAAVVTMHSHFDHALDAPLVAKQTGALLVGAKSTANIGRGYGLPENGGVDIRLQMEWLWVDAFSGVPR